MDTTNTYFKKKRAKSLLALLAVCGLFIAASLITNFNSWKAIMSVPESIVWMSKNFYPVKDSFTRLPNILNKLLNTIFMSIAATTTSAFFAFLFALLGSNMTKVNGILQKFSRLVASVFRNVPEVVWAMIFLFTFSQSMVTGFLALFFVTFGVLTRAFIEAIDEASVESVEALQATGASYFQIIGQAIIPCSIAQVISWVLYMIETNVRSATLIGILTGTGIGHLFNLYYKSLKYHEAALVVLSVILSVFIIETISNKVRRAIL
ncbi:phosphonate ABC transporter, permease protein PhnE [Guggenheimella bovis]